MANFVWILFWPVGHFCSNLKKKWCAPVTQYVCSPCQLWSKSVQTSLRNCSGHVKNDDLALLHENDRELAILYKITKKLLVHMYLLVYYLCTKFKRKQSLHSRETGMDIIKTKWPPVGHFCSNLKNKITCTCNPICMLTMPTLIQISPVISEKQLRTRENWRFSAFTQRWPWVGHIISNHKKIVGADVSLSIQSMY